MDYIQFYQKTYEYLIEKAKQHNVSEADLQTYLTPNKGGDLISDENTKSLNGVFYRLAFHAQNATMKSNVVQFSKNEKILRDCLYDFDFQAVLKNYTSADCLYEVLKGKIKSSSNAVKEKQVLYKYAKSLLRSAVYLKQFDSYAELIDKFLGLGDMLPIYLSFELEGFGVALACDFIKELDERFDFPKPDVHIKGILKELDLLSETATGDKENYLCISLTREIASKMGVSAYRLDKIWWLICSETFYKHDNIRNHSDAKRKAYINYIKSWLKSTN